MNSFERSIRNYCLLHPDDPLSGYVLKGLEESAAKRKAESKKWKAIATELLAFTETPLKQYSDNETPERRNLLERLKRVGVINLFEVNYQDV